MNFEHLNFARTVAEWPAIRPLLAQAVAHGRGEIHVDDILDLVADDRMTVSVLREGPKIILAIAAEIIQYPRKKILNLAFAGGRDAKFVAHNYFAHLIQMAEKHNATAIQCFCRPSVARLLKQMQPEVVEAYTVMERELA